MESSNNPISGYFYHVTNVKCIEKTDSKDNEQIAVETDSIKTEDINKEDNNIAKGWSNINAYIIKQKDPIYHTRLSYSTNCPKNDVDALINKLKDSTLEDMGTTSKENNKKRIDIKCAFVSITLYQNGLPTISPYPSSAKEGTCHMRCRLSFKILIDNYPECWFWCKKDIQIHYICGKTEDFRKIENAMKNGYRNEYYDNEDFIVNKWIKGGKKGNPIDTKTYTKTMKNKKLNKDGTDWKLVYIERDITANILPLIQNEYEKDKLFYNIAVCGDIPFNKEDVKWDSVEKN